MPIKWMKNIGWLSVYWVADNAVPETTIDRSDIIATHLFICYIIYVGCGLYYDFIWAWKSGKKPSANNDMNSKTMPIIWFYWVLCLASGSK